MPLKSYTTSAADNVMYLPEQVRPGLVNDGVRSIQADVREFYNEPEWIEYGVGDGAGDGETDDYSALFSSTTEFVIEGADVTGAYVSNRRVRVTVNGGTAILGTIVDSTYSAPDTTVEVDWDSTVLSDGALRVWLGAISSPASLPRGQELEALAEGTPDTLIGYDSSGAPIEITAGDNIIISAGEISAPTAAGVTSILYEVQTIGTGGTYTLTADDRFIRKSGGDAIVRTLRPRNNTPASTITITIPDSSSISAPGYRFEFIVAPDQTGAVTIQRETNGTINGATSITLGGPNAVCLIEVMSNGGTTPVMVAFGDTTEDKVVDGDQDFTGDVHIQGNLTVDGTYPGGGGGGGNSFGTIAVSGQPNVVADSANDTLTIASTDLTITNNATTDTMTVDVAARAITVAKMQAISTARLLGRGTSGSGDIEQLTLGTGLAISGGALTLTGGKQTIWVPAAAMRPSASGGCAALALVATSANRPDISSLDFDAATQEYAQFSVAMPKSWNEGTLTAQIGWSHAATTTNFAVIWGIQAVAISDDDSMDAAFGTAQEMTDTGGTTNDLYVSAATSAITAGGSPAENDLLCFRVYRKAADVGDTLAVDARLHGVRLFFTTNAGTDD